MTLNSRSLSQLLRRSLISSLPSIIPIISPGRLVICQRNTKDWGVCLIHLKEKEIIWVQLITHIHRTLIYLANSLSTTSFIFCLCCSTTSYYLFKNNLWNEITRSNNSHFPLWYMLSNFPTERGCSVIPRTTCYEYVHFFTL